MSRMNNDDISDLFRRAMDEAVRRGEGDDGANGDETPPQQRPPRPPRPPLRPWWTNRRLWIVGILIIFFSSFSWIVTTYTEWLWFSQVGYQAVWLKQWGAEVIIFLIFFVVGAILLVANWRLARRSALASPQQGVQLMRQPGTAALVTAVALFFAYVSSSVASSQWELFLRYLNRVPFGESDPIFNQDVSFYLFELPVMQFLQGWFQSLIVIGLIGVAAIYLLNNLPTVRGRQLELSNLPLAARQHMALLGTFFLLLWAFGYWLDTYELLYSSRGVAFGASYTDLRATLPVLRVQMVLMILLALSVGLTIFRAEWRPAFGVFGLWVLVTVLGGNLYPAILQRFVVEPNELALEDPYIQYNIDFTRMAFGLDRVQANPFSPIGELTPADLAENDAALNNIRLWDYRPLLDTYSQLQELRPYYQFGEVDIDRYEIDGEVQQVMLAVRELDPAGLQNQSWVNQKLEFTHGYGLVMNPVDQVTREGQPEFYIQDLPPQINIDLEVTRPEIYYGEFNEEVVFVASDLEEFDYPSGNENVYGSYQGLGGVPLGGFLNRLAFAFRFGETNLLLSQYITPETRVLFHRTVQERIRHITPFLFFDHDPYIVVADGRLVWMIDAYTLSNDFPYSQPSQVATATLPGGINYIRNTVKITVDAYDGTVTYYMADESDPLIQSYAQIFPDLFRPLSEMPESLQSHIRYPEGLFIIQTRRYLKYHMTEVQVFYNQEDLWEIPKELFDQGAPQDIEPYYVSFRLPGEAETEYLLIEPYVPAGKNNMIAWIAARNDPEHYGELVVYELPKQELVLGPLQIEGLIDQDTNISQQISLWNQQGSRVIRGNLIVVPINNSFLYVEPLYLQSEASSLPELKRVIVASGNRLVMRENLPDALAALLEADPVDIALEEVEDVGDVAVDDTTDTETGTIDPLPDDATVEQLIESANAHFEAAEAAQREGDWATYGAEIEALEQDLARLLELTGE